MFAHFGGDVLHRVGVVNGDAFGGQRPGEGGFGFIVAAHLVAVGPEPAGQGRHADAADAEEENVGKLVQIVTLVGMSCIEAVSIAVSNQLVATSLVSAAREFFDCVDDVTS